jgi:hypothetical protein
MFVSLKKLRFANDKNRRNKQILTNDYKMLNRSNMLKLGLQPTIEAQDPNKIRVSVMNTLTSMTYEPRKTFSELFNSNDINTFYKYSNEFMKKLKNRQNLSATELISEFEAFKTIDIPKLLVAKDGTLEERIKYEEDKQRLIERETDSRFKLQNDADMDRADLFLDVAEQQESAERENLDSIRQSERELLQNKLMKDGYNTLKRELMQKAKDIYGKVSLMEENIFEDKLKQLADNIKITNKIDQLIKDKKEIQEENKRLLEGHRNPPHYNKKEHTNNKILIQRIDNEIKKERKLIKEIETDKNLESDISKLTGSGIKRKAALQPVAKQPKAKIAHVVCNPALQTVSNRSVLIKMRPKKSKTIQYNSFDWL